MIIKKCVQLAIACSFVGFVAVSYAHAQINRNNRTLLTFSQPVEVPGHVLPAGTYTFELDDSQMNRHIVRIYDKNGTSLIATVLAIPDYRLTRTADTVVRFKEVSAGAPEAIRAWFFPGRTVGDELVYPKAQATALATTSGVIVPATDTTSGASAKTATMKNAKIVAMTPKHTEEPLTAIETTPAKTTAPLPTPPAPMTPAASLPPPATPPAPAATPRTELPHTASGLPLIALLGAGVLALGLAVRRIVPARSGR